MYSRHGIALDEVGSWNFSNDFANNFVIFGFYNSSSCHADNHKNNVLALVEGPTFGINGSFALPEEKFSINFSKANTEHYFSFQYNGDNSYLFFNGNKLFRFTADNKNVNSPAQFCLGSISNGFGATESREMYLKENVYDFLVDYNAIY